MTFPTSKPSVPFDVNINHLRATRPLKIIDIFSGVGGLSYGFAHNDNFNIIAANEILPNMAKAYALNHPTVRVYNENIQSFNSAKIKTDIGVDAREVDIIVGGPPCQAYSTAGKRLINDPRGSLFQEYYRILNEFAPSLFVFENVKGILSMQGGNLFKTIITLFESLGYKIQYKLLNAADYGVPQIRERVVIVGSKLKTCFEFPPPTHYNPAEKFASTPLTLKPYLTIEDAIGDLPFIKSNEASTIYSSDPQTEFQKLMRQNAPLQVLDHSAPNNNPKLVKIMESLPDGGTPEHLPEELRPASGFKNTYCRLWWKKPAPTITRNLSTPSSARCIHPKAPRPLTTREGARLQSFPDNYLFFGSRSDKNLQIGNAVPPFLSTALAQAVLKTFEIESQQTL